jgi:hypothetical protein
MVERRSRRPGPWRKRTRALSCARNAPSSARARSHLPPSVNIVFFPKRRGEEAMTIIIPNQRFERRFWAAVRLAVVWPIALAALAFATASWAEDARKGAVPDKQVQAKLQYCKVCHGVSAQGFRGYNQYHASPDSNPHTCKISCRLSLNIDEQTTSCSTSHIR